MSLKSESKKIIPKIFKNICITAHPEGCYKSVESQVNYVRDQGKIYGPKNVLVLGASTGYGLASRIVSYFGSGAATIGVSFEKEGSENELGSGGWYNTRAFDKIANNKDQFNCSIFGDAFSEKTKFKTIQLIKSKMKKIDLIVYSIAAPKRIDPFTNKEYNSAIKAIGDNYTFKTLDIRNKVVYDKVIEAATDDEIKGTVKVMGGEDWELWIKKLEYEGLLADGFKTVAYSYIGPEFTYPIYRQGTLGKAKEDLEKTAKKINERLKRINGKALISINKALITRASAVIPAVPLYISILYTVMKKKGIHEDCIHQIYRLFHDHLYNNNLILDDEGRIRIDNYELRKDVQKEIMNIFNKVNNENLEKLTDYSGFLNAYLNFHGFNFEGVNYDENVRLNEWS